VDWRVANGERPGSQCFCPRLFQYKIGINDLLKAFTSSGRSSCLSAATGPLLARYTVGTVVRKCIWHEERPRRSVVWCSMVWIAVGAFSLGSKCNASIPQPLACDQQQAFQL
jgi:hypothetical protein